MASQMAKSLKEQATKTATQVEKTGIGEHVLKPLHMAGQGVAQFVKGVTLEPAKAIGGLAHTAGSKVGQKLDSSLTSYTSSKNQDKFWKAKCTVPEVKDIASNETLEQYLEKFGLNDYEQLDNVIDFFPATPVDGEIKIQVPDDQPKKAITFLEKAWDLEDLEFKLTKKQYTGKFSKTFTGAFAFDTFDNIEGKDQVKSVAYNKLKNAEDITNKIILAQEMSCWAQHKQRNTLIALTFVAAGLMMGMAYAGYHVKSNEDVYNGQGGFVVVPALNTVGVGMLSAVLLSEIEDGLLEPLSIPEESAVRRVLEKDCTKQQCALVANAADIPKRVKDIMKSKKKDMRLFIGGFITTLILTFIANYYQGPDPTCEKDKTGKSAGGANGVPYGLFVACLLNFMCDGIMAGELLKSKQNVAPTFLGLSLDNMVLLFILGSRLHANQSKMFTLCGIVIGIFFVCMMLGLNSSWLAELSSNYESFFKGVVFNVLIYTILVELCPESSDFKDLDNCDVKDDKKPKTAFNKVAMFFVNQWGYFYPLILFISFFVMKLFS